MGDANEGTFLCPSLAGQEKVTSSDTLIVCFLLKLTRKGETHGHVCVRNYRFSVLKHSGARTSRNMLKLYMLRNRSESSSLTLYFNNSFFYFSFPKWAIGSLKKDSPFSPTMMINHVCIALFSNRNELTALYTITQHLY